MGREEEGGGLQVVVLLDCVGDRLGVGRWWTTRRHRSLFVVCSVWLRCSSVIASGSCVFVCLLLEVSRNVWLLGAPRIGHIALPNIHQYRASRELCLRFAVDTLFLLGDHHAARKRESSELTTHTADFLLVYATRSFEMLDILNP